MLLGIGLAPGCIASPARPGIGHPLALRESSGPRLTASAARTESPTSALLPRAAPAPHLSSPLDASWDPASSSLLVGGVREDPAADLPWERFSISAGGLLATLDSDVRLGASGLGVSVSLEDLLDFDSDTASVRAEAAWRFTKSRRHRLELSWVDLGRGARTTLGQDLDLGNGTVLPGGTDVSSTFDLSLLKGEYSYSFFQDERFDLAGALGLYVAPIDFTLDAQGVVTYSDQLRFTAPLPVGGVRMDFAITPKWFLRTDLNLFYLRYDDFEGSISTFTGAVEWRAWEHFAMGLGIDSFQFGLEYNDSTPALGVDVVGAVDFRYSGLLLYLKGLW